MHWIFLFHVIAKFVNLEYNSSRETNRKHKHDEIQGDFADKAYGIITDCEHGILLSLLWIRDWT